jgi:hypothetical protein
MLYRFANPLFYSLGFILHRNGEQAASAACSIEGYVIRC